MTKITFEQINQAGFIAANKKTVSETGCSACQKEGDLFLLPLRYSVAGKTSHALPPLPHWLLNPDFPVLTHSLYTIQMLRRGFCYVLEERANLSYWRRFSVSEDGCLLELNKGEQPDIPAKFGCDVNTHGINASMINFRQSDQLTGLYFLFCPNAVTEARLSQLEKEEKHTLQFINPKQLMTRSRLSQAARCLSAEEIRQHVFEFQMSEKMDKALNPPPGLRRPHLTTYLEQVSQSAISFYYSQLYPIPSLDKSRPRLEGITRALARFNGVGVVIDDGIGITQALTNWRNAAIEDQLRPWLNAKDSKGVNNEHKHQVMLKLQQLQAQLEETHIEMTTRKEVEHYMWLLTTSVKEAEEGGWSFKPDFLSNAEEQTRKSVIARVKKELTAEKTAELKQKFNKKYWSKIEKQLTQFKRELEKESHHAELKAENRAKDAVAWLESHSLFNSLACYDDNNLKNGLFFTEQVGLCLFGLETSDTYKIVLDQWIGTVDNTCLYWRGLLHNQKEGVETLKKSTQTEADFFDDKQLTAYFKRVEQFHGFLDKSMSLLDDLEKNQRLVAEKVVGSGIFVFFASQYRTLLKANSPNAVDKLLNSTIKAFATWGTKGINFNVALETLGQEKGTSETVRLAKMTQSVANEYLDEELYQSARGKGNFYKVRQASNKLLIQALFFYLKSQETAQREDNRQRWEFGSALLATTAAGIEIITAGMANLDVKGGTLAKSTAVYLGGLKFWAGTMNTLAGGVMACYDFADTYKSYQRENYILVIAYFAKGVAFSLLTAGSFMESIVAGQAYFKYLAKHGSKGWIKDAGALGIKISQQLIKGQAAKAAGQLGIHFALRGATALMAWVPYLGWITLGITVVFSVFDDDELEKWVQQSCFRDHREKGEYFTVLDNELDALDSAYYGVM